MTLQKQKTLPSLLLVFLLLLEFLSGTACQSGSPSIEIDSPQAILSPVIIGSCSVFLNIDNKGRGPDRLISARLHDTGTVAELHIMDGGKMRKTDRIEIPSSHAVHLRPAGPHVMVFRMPKGSKKGDVFTMTLSFEKSGEKVISVPIVEKYEKPSGRQN